MRRVALQQGANGRMGVEEFRISLDAMKRSEIPPSGRRWRAASVPPEVSIPRHYSSSPEASWMVCTAPAEPSEVFPEALPLMVM